MVDLLSYFSFQLVLYNQCNTDPEMCYPVCRMVHIKDSLLLIKRVAHEVTVASLFSCYLSGPLPYI